MSRIIIQAFDVLVLDLSAKHAPGQHHDCEIVDVATFLLDRSVASHVHRLATQFEAHPGGFGDVVDLADNANFKLGFRPYGPTTGVIRISGAAGPLVEAVVSLGDQTYRSSLEDFNTGMGTQEVVDGDDDLDLLGENWPHDLDQYDAFRAVHALVLAKNSRDAAQHVAAIGQMERPSLIGFILQRTNRRLREATILKLAQIACAYLTTRK